MEKVGFSQSLDKNDDEADPEEVRKKAEEMWDRSDKKDKKGPYVTKKNTKMLSADINQEKKGKPVRINGLKDEE